MTVTQQVSGSQNQVTRYVSDPSKQKITQVTLVAQTAGNSDLSTNYTYDPSGYLTDVTYPEGNGLHNDVDANGNVTSSQLKNKSGVLTSGVSASYDCSIAAKCDKPVWTRDALYTAQDRGHQTDYEYNSAGQVTSVTLPPALDGVRPETIYTYTPTAGVSLLTKTSTCRVSQICSDPANELVSAIGYDDNLQPNAVSRGAGGPSNGAPALTATTSATYDAVGNIYTVDGPLPGSGDAITINHNADRQVTSTVTADPDGGGPLVRRASVIHYAPDGQADSYSVGSFDSQDHFTSMHVNVLEHDTLHRASRAVEYTRDPAQGGTVLSVVQYGYDALNRVTCTVQRMNTSSWMNGADACAPDTSDSANQDRVTQTHYDEFGRPDYVIQGKGAVPVNGPAATSTERTRYTPNGKTGTLTDGKGNVTAYAYDGLDRAWRTCFQTASSAACAGSPSDYEELGHDDNGNVTSRRVRDTRTIGYAYDAIGRLVTKSPAGSRSVFYSYDPASILLAASFDGFGTVDHVSRVVDALGRTRSETSSVANSGGPAITRTMGYDYDLAGHVTSVVHPDGTSFRLTYDDLGEWQRAYWTSPISNNTDIGFVQNFYDDLGRRTAINRASSYTGYNWVNGRLLDQDQQFAGGTGNDSYHFGYNAAGQIASRTNGNDDYTWSEARNVSRPYQPNGLNQYDSVAGLQFNYDRNGNLTHDGVMSTDYGYDIENRMVSSSASGGTALSYDPLGRLTRTTSAAHGTTKFVYDGEHIAVEYDGGDNGGVVKRRFMWGPDRADEPILQDEGNRMDCSRTRFLHTDERGSVVATADCSGNRQDVNTYDEHGAPGAGNWADGRFGYTGQAYLPDLGLWYYKARMYSPSLGRFMQTDPIGYGDGLNWYAYAHGDPVNGTDPSGLASFSYCVTVGGGSYSGPAYGGTSPEVVVVATTHHCTQVDYPDIAPTYLAPPGAPPVPAGTGPSSPAPTPPAQQKDDCANRNASGECVYVRDDKGKLQLDPDYAKKACQNYKAMMQSNKEVAAAAGATNLPGLANATTGGSVGLLGRVAKFFSAPGFVFLRGVTYLTAGALSFGSSPPPGCK